MDPARLAELRRHREQVRELLTWLDRQIAAESEPAPAPPAMPVAIDPRSADALTAETAASLHAAEGYAPDPAAAALNTRRGCLVAAGLGLLTFALLLTLIYFVGYRDRGVFTSKPNTESHPAPAPRR